MRAGREMSERLELGLPLTIFPEGRSSRGTEILPFQPSLLEPAARAGVPCFAASISYETPGAALPPSRTICWYDSESLLTHFPRLIGLKRVVARVSIRGPARPLDRPEVAGARAVGTGHRVVPCAGVGGQGDRHRRCRPGACPLLFRGLPDVGADEVPRKAPFVGHAGLRRELHVGHVDDPRGLVAEVAAAVRHARRDADQDRLPVARA